jgi:hypothetical protein
MIYDYKAMVPSLIVTAVLALSTLLTIPVSASDLPTRVSAASDPSWNENIVFADLHIIQAIKDLLANNTTGALDQLALAQEQLDRALMIQN